MTGDFDDGPSSSVHHHQVDAELQHDDCINFTEVTADTLSNIITPNYSQHSLIRLKSGRIIWWSDNGIKSHRLEVMLRRRMRFLQEEELQRQQERVEDEYYNDMGDVECHDLVQSSANVDTVTQKVSGNRDYHLEMNEKEPNNTAASLSQDRTALKLESNTKMTSLHDTNNHNTINAVNEVSLESIDEQTILSQRLPKSNRQSLQYCYENNIPVITVGTSTSSFKMKKTWLDFGEENANVVGAVSTRQFLIHSSTSTTSDVMDESSSTMLKADDDYLQESPINVALERISSKQGFICMLHDSSSTTSCTNHHAEASLDPIHLQLKHGDVQMIYVVWNPVQEGCVRENIRLHASIGEEQIMRHDISLVGSARDSDGMYHTEKEEWNGLSEEYSEIRKDDSNFDLVVEGVGLIVTDDSIECSSIVTGGGANDLIDSNEAHEIAQMMQNASISPKKASMAAKSLSKVSEPRAEQVVNREVDANQIMAAHEVIDSERLFAEESRLIPQTSQDFVNGRYMNDKVRHLLDDFDAESASVDDRRSGRSTPTFGSLSSEDECNRSDVSQGLYDNERLISQFGSVDEKITVENRERGIDSVDADARIEDQQHVERFNTATSDHYHKVTAELNALMGDASDDLQSQSESDDGSSSFPETYDQRQSTERLGTVTSDHYHKVTVELNALMGDTSHDLQSRSENDDGSPSSPENCDQKQSTERLGTAASNQYQKVATALNALMEDASNDLHSHLESDDDVSSFPDKSDQSEGSSLDEPMSNEENEDLNILPETSLDPSHDWDSSPENDTTDDSDQWRNEYGRMSSDLNDLMNEISGLEKFAQMQQDYLFSPTTHDFQTQLEHINDQIDNLTPSPANATKSKIHGYDTPVNRPAPMANEARMVKTTSKPPTPKDSAQKCYFFKAPPKEVNKQTWQTSLLPAQSSNGIEKRVQYKSPFRCVVEADTSFQSIDSISDGLSSSDSSAHASKTNCDETNTSDGILIDTSSLDESISSGESEFDSSVHSSVDLDGSSALLSSSSSETLPPACNMATIESLQETRSEQIAVMKSKLSSINGCTNDQFRTPLVSRIRESSLQTKISQPSSAQNLELKTPAPSSTSQKLKTQHYSPPTKIPQPTSSTRKLQLKTPTLKSLDVASLTASASMVQSARMTYGNFSQSSPNTDNSPRDSESTGVSRLPRKKSSLETPPSMRAPAQLKTPLSMSAYEKHIERIRRSRSTKEFS